MEINRSNILSSQEIGETDVIPYLPDFYIWHRYIQSLLDRFRQNPTDSVDLSPVKFLPSDAGVKPRDVARTTVAGARNSSPVRLSVAIEGGSSVVKRGKYDEWKISDHGRWRQMHLGAIEAAYGSTPYFRHLYPVLAEIIMSAEAGTPFTVLTDSLHTACLKFLEFHEIIPEILRLSEVNPEKFRKIATEYNISADTNIAFLDVIFKMGKDSIFTLLKPIDAV